MDAGRDPLAGLLGPVSDGEAIDWDAVVRRVGPDDLTIVEALREVDRIGSFSRGLQRAGRAADGDGDGAAAGGAAGEVARWGDLLLLERLGGGAQAEVWRAWDPRLHREVALKLLRPGAPGDGASAAASPLLAEGRALARVRHPNVVAVHGIDEHDGRVGLSMELARGQTLEQHVAARGPLAPDEAARLGREVGAALAAVHEAGLLHRDVKPANVVRDADGRWLLADFGLGRPRPAEPDGAAPSLPAGSPMYMAPELLFGAAPDVRADVYALGLLVWFALVGAHPFGRLTWAQLRAAAANGPRPSLAERRPGLPPALVAAVEAAIAPTASKRLATAAAFVEALDAAPADGVPAAPARERRARPGSRALVAGLLAIGLAASVIGLASRRGAASGGTAPAYDVEATLLRHGGGPAEPLVPGAVVAPGDRLSLRWQASRPLWVYVLNADDHGESFLLFPQPRYAVRNPLPADAVVDLPGRIDGSEFAWTVTSAGGRETFLVVASPAPLAELEEGAAGLAAPVPAAALGRLRGVGGLAPLPAGQATPAGAGEAALARFRALAGRESGVRGVWVREIVLRNPG